MLVVLITAEFCDGLGTSVCKVEVFGTGGSWPTSVAVLRDVLIRFREAGMSICAGLFVPEVF